MRTLFYKRQHGLSQIIKLPLQALANLSHLIVDLGDLVRLESGIQLGAGDPRRRQSIRLHEQERYRRDREKYPLERRMFDESWRVFASKTMNEEQFRF